MKQILTISFLFITLLISAQGRLIDRTGVASFYSATPIEDIEAINNQALGALEIKTGNVAVSLLIKGFRFEKALMQEHFNENYIESDKFPKATFSGKLTGFNAAEFLNPGTRTYESSGNLMIHGVTKPIVTQVEIEVTSSVILVRTEFNLKVADFDIEIPRLMRDNIAKVVTVRSSFTFDIPK